MFIKLNKNTLCVNFNKHKLNYVICDIKDLLIKREYIVIPIIYIGGHLKLNRTNLYITLLPEIKKRINICNYEHKKYEERR